VSINLISKQITGGERHEQSNQKTQAAARRAYVCAMEWKLLIEPFCSSKDVCIDDSLASFPSDDEIF
jgi:hypothetical protein